ncbi:Aldo/keto reductase [Mycena crocata]|nr:Aldo/keto reductase [Mycena crocata]
MCRPLSVTSPGAVRLGSSGLKVFKIVFGCMTYGTSDWHEWILSEQLETAATITNSFDTALVRSSSDAMKKVHTCSQVYSAGSSGEILGKAIKKYNLPRNEILVMAKVFGYVAWKKPREDEATRTVNQRGLSRKLIFDSVKNSLELLQFDYIDLLQCHHFEYDTPIEETVSLPSDSCFCGLRRYIGMSSCWAWQFHVMQNYVITHNLTPFILMQNHHSLLYREEEREMFPTLKHFGVGIIPSSPLARGILTRPVSAQKDTSQGISNRFVHRYNAGGSADILACVEELAKKRGVLMAQIVLAIGTASLLFRTEHYPIFFCVAANRILIWHLPAGARVTAPSSTVSLEQLAACLAAVQLKLTPEEMTLLEEAYTP